MRIIRRQSTIVKYSAINRRFNDLMKRDANGIRPNVDDVIALLAAQYFCSTYTIERALTTPVDKLTA
jgi:hypothetical protein